MDMAVKENVLYADNAIDMLAIDISDVTAPKLLKRLNAVLTDHMDGAPMWTINPS